jgi:hypothetical protein
LFLETVKIEGYEFPAICIATSQTPQEIRPAVLESGYEFGERWDIPQTDGRTN